MAHIGFGFYMICCGTSLLPNLKSSRNTPSPPWKTKVTLENHPFSIGNTSSNGRCVIVILVFGGCILTNFSLFAYLTHPKVGFLEEHLWMFFVGLTMGFITIFHHKRNYPSIATPPLCINFRYFAKGFKCIRSSHPILNLPQKKLAMRPFNSHPTDLWETTRIGNRIFFVKKKKNFSTCEMGPLASLAIINRVITHLSMVLTYNHTYSLKAISKGSHPYL